MQCCHRRSTPIAERRAAERSVHRKPNCKILIGSCSQPPAPPALAPKSHGNPPVKPLQRPMCKRQRSMRRPLVQLMVIGGARSASRQQARPRQRKQAQYLGPKVTSPTHPLARRSNTNQRLPACNGRSSPLLHSGWLSPTIDARASSTPFFLDQYRLLLAGRAVAATIGSSPPCPTAA